MIVTLDGPAGAGKSSVAKTLAARLGFRFLDTGAMYRAVALAALRQSCDWSDELRLAEVAMGVTLEMQDERVLLNGEDVSDEIRSRAVTAVIHHVADNVAIRARLVQLQRQIAAGGNFVTEGRDQGTVAFPDADCKIFLTATPAERARRRVRDLACRGVEAEFDEVLAEQTERDRRDQSRPVGRLAQAADAVVLYTDQMTEDEVVASLDQIVREKKQRLNADV